MKRKLGRSTMKKAAAFLLGVTLIMGMSGCGVTREEDGTSAAPTESSSEAGDASEASSEDGSASKDGLIPVTFQSKWIPQAQFMGYYVALDKGYYEEEGLDVTILPGGSDINVPSVVESGTAQIGTTNLYNILSYQEQGYPLTTIGQVMQDSPFVFVCHKDQVSSIADLKGKTLGVWTGGNDAPVRALLTKNGMNPDMDATLASQGTTIDGFLDGTFAGYSAMTYNELLLAYEAGYTDDDLYIISMEEEGCGMLADCIFVNSDWLKDNRETAEKFMRATIKGWAYACENTKEAADIVYSYMDKSSADYDHQVKSAEEVAKLVLPEGMDASQICTIPADKVQNSIDIALQYGIITKDTDLNTVYDTSIMDDITSGSTAE